MQAAFIQAASILKARTYCIEPPQWVFDPEEVRLIRQTILEQNLARQQSYRRPNSHEDTFKACIMPVVIGGIQLLSLSGSGRGWTLLHAHV